MERLFRVTYRHPLESARGPRTDDRGLGSHPAPRGDRPLRGRPRDEIRAVIRTVGTPRRPSRLPRRGGGRPDPLQAFLERCALLHVATPQLAAAAGVSIPRRDGSWTSPRRRACSPGAAARARLAACSTPSSAASSRGGSWRRSDPDGISEIHAGSPRSRRPSGSSRPPTQRPPQPQRRRRPGPRCVVGSDPRIGRRAGGGRPDRRGWRPRTTEVGPRPWLRARSPRGRHRAGVRRRLAVAASTHGDPTISLTVRARHPSRWSGTSAEPAAAIEHAIRLREAGCRHGLCLAKRGPVCRAPMPS